MTPEEYEEELARLPPRRPMADWDVGDARAAARAAFLNTPAEMSAASAMAEAHQQFRHAVSPRRLAGIRRTRPDLADMIEDDLAWLRGVVANFDLLPFRDKVRHWRMVTTVPEAGGDVPSTRGTSPTWPGLREATFVLLDWHNAVCGDPPSRVWLAEELASLEPGLLTPSASGVRRELKLAAYLLAEWKAARL